jgi:uncharacterized protein YggU (UPF0235/DUF167 family)
VPPVASHPRGSELSLTITPRAAFNSMELEPAGTLRVRVTAPPVDGAANTALLRYLARVLDVPKSQLSISAGPTSRHKRILVTGISPTDLEHRLHKALASPTSGDS